MEFIPHPWLRNGHLQTLAGMATSALPTEPVRHEVMLSDGDRVVLHDDVPLGWQHGRRTALLVHGLCGSHRSGYLCRVAARLNALGIRTFRIDLRGCGVGIALAKNPYHSGRSEDLHAALLAIARLCPGSPTSLIAFSLGANIALKLLGECGGRPPGNLDRAVAVSPPVDLALCVSALRRYPARFYDRFFTTTLLRQVRASPTLAEAATRIFATQEPTRLIEFDDAFTAPLSGFGDAATYYRRCSAAPLLGYIRVPTTVLIAKDDPIVPWQPLVAQPLSDSITLHITNHGGHLGFMAAQPGNGRRWMDEQVTTWAIAD